MNPKTTLSGRDPTAAEVLRAMAASRGWVVGAGLPDEARAGRAILKDFCDGKLLSYEWPPGHVGGAHPPRCCWLIADMQFPQSLLGFF